MPTPTLSDIQSEIGRSSAGWVARDNPIWSLSPADRIRRLGCVEPADGMVWSGPVHHGPGASLPSMYDLRRLGGKNYVTPVREQGECGSCVAFGVLGAMEALLSHQQNKTDPTLDLSEAQLFFCDGHSQGATCATGWWPGKALPFCINPGIVDEACFPYTDHDQKCALCEYWQKRTHRIKAFAQIASQTAIKDWLVNRGTVTLAFDVYTDFFSYHSGVYRHVTGNYDGGHCVALIGYDDKQSCWICKNSWNIHWGEAGFFRIGYGQCRIDSWGVFGLG